MTQAKSAVEKAQNVVTEACRAEAPRPALTRPREEKRATAETGDTIPAAPAAVLDAGAGADSAAGVSKAAG